ncbi:hypothetical protein SAMN05216343_11037 [Oscillibacter sp. PC13]|uniref:hypothetical protein n=1 Tax=Oscillibacter sp. PC13 TaxID=1855299 RepID=UPI0008E610EE|nr:hypothetical protein [Oscillibacter sp. PC13]SFP59874.1 hypothetical protein SAMN05216343_11037 [Oscillibacter sp. PC13]
MPKQGRYDLARGTVGKQSLRFGIPLTPSNPLRAIFSMMARGPLAGATTMLVTKSTDFLIGMFNGMKAMHA